MSTATHPTPDPADLRRRLANLRERRKDTDEQLDAIFTKLENDVADLRRPILHRIFRKR